MKESQVAVMEEFLENIQLLIGALGYKVIEPSDELNDGADATGKRVSDGFVVLKGSRIEPTVTPSCPSNVITLRNRYADSIDENFELTSNITFGSPSTATSFISGASQNGLTLWHDSNGRTLKDIELQV